MPDPLRARRAAPRGAVTTPVTVVAAGVNLCGRMRFTRPDLATRERDLIDKFP
jgi:hypothetical protein